MRPRCSRSPFPTGVSLAVLMACGLALPGTPALAASLRVQGFSQASNDPDVQDPVDESGPVAPISGTAMSQGFATVGTGAASGQVAGSARYGLLRVQATGGASGPYGDQGGGIGGGSIEASWTDTFTITPSNPNLDFTEGTFVFSILLSGSLAASSGGATESNTRAQYSLFVDAGTCIMGCDFRVDGEQADFGSLGGGVVASGDPIGPFTSTPVPFLFGVPIDLTVALSAFAQAVAGLEAVSSTADANLSNTLVWGGFVEVRDASANLVTGYGVSSDSSVDWSQPVAVPEPASVLQAAWGLLGLAAAARRRRR